MPDANEIECLIFETAIKNIDLEKITKSGVSDANNKLIITIFLQWGHTDPTYHFFVNRIMIAFFCIIYHLGDFSLF